MFNIEESWNTTNAFRFSRPHHSMLRHFGDTLKTFARLNITRASGGSHFPLKTLECFKTFFEDLGFHTMHFFSFLPPPPL